MTDYTSAEFWAGAPEGATHFNPVSRDWYRVDEHAVMAWLSPDNYWADSFFWVKRKHLCIPRPTTQPAAWSGEGLPPVGAECLACWTSANREYYKARVIAHDGGEIIYRWLDGPGAGLIRADDGNDFEMGKVKAFLPIRTPEQIAAAKREAYIQRMVEACFYKASESTRIDCEALYDHGLRFKDDSK